MKRKINVVLCFVFLAACFPSKILAWGREGHEIVGLIACEIRIEGGMDISIDFFRKVSSA